MFTLSRTFSLVIGAILAIALVYAYATFPPGSRLFPIAVGIPTLLAIGWSLRRPAIGGGSVAAGSPDGDGDESLLGLGPNVWFYGFIAFAMGFGIGIVGPLFITAYMRIEARTSWLAAALGSAAFLGIVRVASELLSLTVPGGLLLP